MFSKIWENIVQVIAIIYEKIVKRLIKPAFFIYILICIYFFIYHFIRYQIILAFMNLFAAMFFYTMLEEED